LKETFTLQPSTLQCFCNVFSTFYTT